MYYFHSPLYLHCMTAKDIVFRMNLILLFFNFIAILFLGYKEQNYSLVNLYIKLHCSIVFSILFSSLFHGTYFFFRFLLYILFAFNVLFMQILLRNVLKYELGFFLFSLSESIFGFLYVFSCFFFPTLFIFCM